jgi:type I pantothenate kinase
MGSLRCSLARAAYGKNVPRDASAAESNGSFPTPFVELDRSAWSRLAKNHPLEITADDLTRLRGLDHPLDLREVQEVYLPLSRLLTFYCEAVEQLHGVTSDFLMERRQKHPVRHRCRWVGRRRQVDDLPHPARAALPVAVDTQRRAHHHRRVSAAQRRAAAARDCCTARVSPSPTTGGRCCASSPRSRAGGPRCRRPFIRTCPMTSSLVSGWSCANPDVLIVEGLNVLGAPPVRPDGRDGPRGQRLLRLLGLCRRAGVTHRTLVRRPLPHLAPATAFANPDSYFHRYAALSNAEAVATALTIWESINGPNLVENILPTRQRATLVIVKGEDHSVQKVRLRKL